MGNSTSSRALPVLLLVLAAAACEREPTSPVEGSAELTGTVARLKTGQGVPNLLIALVRGDELVAAAATDADGVFRFPEVPPGTYTARLTGFELAGIRPATTAFEPEVREVTMDGAPAELVFAAVGLFTQVLAEVTCDGSPATDVAVRVVGGAIDTVVRTNALGEVVAPVDPGHYALIPSDSPCALQAPFQVVEVLQGQTVRVPFGGAS